MIVYHGSTEIIKNPSEWVMVCHVPLFTKHCIQCITNRGFVETPGREVSLFKIDILCYTDNKFKTIKGEM